MRHLLLLTILLAACGQVPESSNYVAHHPECQAQPVEKPNPGQIPVDITCPESEVSE